MKPLLGHTRLLTTPFISLDTGTCKACWKCVDTCSKEVIGTVDFLGHRHARLAAPERCAGCLQCVTACPSGAITRAATDSSRKPVAVQSAPRPFNVRAFVSLGLFIAGAALPVSGIMNHNLQFEPLTQARHFWMSVHNMSALLATVFGIWHLILNRRPLLRYAREAQRVLASKEALAALGLVMGVVGLFAAHAFAVR